MRVYLSGFMGSGKSTVGPQVAARLGQPFLDLDRMIQTRDGRSIPQIFEEDGERRFRELETKALEEATETGDVVVALGGGAVVDDTNRRFVKEHGLLVYLDVDTETVLERVGEEASERPLLQNEDGIPLSRNNMIDRIQDLLDERRAAYMDAHAIVDATQAVSEVVTAVVEVVRNAAEQGSTSEKE